MIKFNQVQKSIPFNKANLSAKLNEFDTIISKRLMFVLGKTNVVDSIYYKTTDNTLNILPVNSGNGTKLTNDAIPLLRELINAIYKYRQKRLSDEIIEDVDALLGPGNIDKFGTYRSDAIMIRDDENKVDYEVIFQDMKYSDKFTTGPAKN